MLKKALSAVAIILAGIVAGTDAFAQRSVNSAQDAARAAKNSLSNKSGQSSSQIEWLNSVINVVNMNESGKRDVAAENNKAIEESRGR